MRRSGPPFADCSLDAAPPSPASRQDPGEGVEALHRTAALVESSEDPIIGLTLEGVITDWNPAAQRLYGYSLEDAVGASIGMLVPPELRGSTNLLARVAAGEPVSQVDTQRMARDGQRIDVSVSMSPIRDRRGAIVGAAAFTRDIRARTLAEERLRRSQAQLGDAEEVAALGSWEWDVASNEVTWSLGLFGILGLDPRLFTPSYEGFFERVHPADRTVLEPRVHGAVATGRPFVEETRVVRGDGVERIAQSRGRAIKDDSGKVVRLVGTVQDITELARARQQLEQVNRDNEALLNSAGEAIFGIDPAGTVTFVNPAATQMTGHEVHELTGAYLHGLVHHSRPDGSHYPAEECPMLASLKDGAVHRCDADVYWRKDGSSFPVEYTSTPIVEDGHVTGAVVVSRDITDRREVERAKDEFTSVVSHELRTPLTSIRGSLGLLESGALGPLPEKGRRMVEIAVQNTDRLVRMINDILDIERIESGKIDMHQEQCDAAELIASAVQELQPAASEAQVRLLLAAESVPILADRDWVHQTLTNLIGNAVKFSPPAGTVRVSSKGHDGEALFQVRDEGRGIPPDKLHSIFGRFQQVDASDSREKGGTGLGLAICLSIVEQHGGRIWAESQPEQGSTFSFALPALT